MLTCPIRLYRYDFPLFQSCLMQTLNTDVEGHSHAYDKEFSTFKHFEKKIWSNNTQAMLPIS